MLIHKSALNEDEDGINGKAYCKKFIHLDIRTHDDYILVNVSNSLRESPVLELQKCLQLESELMRKGWDL